ncbi:DUF1194 domain-containing protein [Histidinibacterium lentulum]|uniref:DUF1194 domain-containing protein n=1 Tax=Histidinibacterium lentulum TaxID=2480588 RepID=A0A3N2QM78_9RHOB|nr:DUF1194 domain-containing protein [Histidinibacterium lentulum]ROT96299.1 DUF1194 domain-containing protein [Histidinibacterium lentulum]
MRCLALLLALASPALAQDTDLELVLLADASGSIDATEIRLQRQGYAEALTDPAVLSAIENTAYGSIAVTYIEWAANQAVVVDWTVIATAEDAEAFAAELMIPPRLASGRNAIGAALLAGLAAIETNDISGWRRVIDFSGDSASNYSGSSIAEARETVLNAGVTINGLPILTERPWLLEVYEREIIGGPNSFAIAADSRATFVEALRRKLILEISGLTPRDETVIAEAPAGTR